MRAVCCGRHPHAVVDVHTGTLRCGPAPSSGKPRSESPPPVKKDSLKGNEAIGEGLCETDPNAVCPHDVMKLLLVERSLRCELRKIDIGAEFGGIDIDFERSEHSFVFIENVVACVACEICSEAGESDMLVCGRNEIGYLNASKVSFTEAVLARRRDSFWRCR